jgi:hypothetical protein
MTSGKLFSYHSVPMHQRIAAHRGSTPPQRRHDGIIIAMYITIIIININNH